MKRQEQLQMIANSNTINITSEDSESADDDDLEYFNYGLQQSQPM